jgi:hypothetical protein
LEFTQPDAPFPVGVWLVNSASIAIRGTLQMKVIDKWRAEPSGPVSFELAPKGWKRLEFQVSFGRGTFNADYPVHAFVEFEHEGKRLTADPVLLLRPKLNDPPRAVLPVDWAPQPVPKNGAFALWRLPVHHQHFMSGDAYPFAVWREPTSTVTEPVEFGVRAQRGEEKETLRVHLGALPPSKRREVEMADVEYPLALPIAQPLKFEFSVAVADSLAVTGAFFRVRAIPF